MLPKLFKTLPIILGVLIVGLFLPAVVLAGNTPVQGNSQYTSSSSEAANDGTSTETLSVHLQDSGNSPVVGDVISLSAPNDSNATFPQNNQTTDGSGDATFTVATKTAGTDQIILYDSTNNVTFGTDWGLTATFYDTSKGCQNSPPAPVISSVISNSNNAATLTWTDSSDPVSNYLVSYGIASGNYIYGDPNIGGQGTTSFTVGALTGGKKYYFAVAATNNCGRSGLSNEMSTVVNPVPATPTPSPQPTVEPTTAPDINSVVPIDSPSDVPTDTPTPTAAPAQNVNSTFRDLGIGVVALGLVLIGSVVVIQIIKKKNKIPPIGGSTPQNPFIEPPSVTVPGQPQNPLPPQQPY